MNLNDLPKSITAKEVLGYLNESSLYMRSMKVPTLDDGFYFAQLPASVAMKIQSHIASLDLATNQDPHEKPECIKQVLSRDMFENCHYLGRFGDFHVVY